MEREEAVKMHQLVEEQLERVTAETEDLRLRLNEELDRVAFLERERTCHVEVRMSVSVMFRYIYRLIPSVH